ncbi:ABC transporter permease [Eremococcus coleocola]|uniref:Putative hemin transport system permease protein HrtB n=1 Tax=Eremococcus coleocola ACS-139-V-Col8 TaxID=908337 RepID=E4KPY3_9LACT|nr:FtsX-like permease family protein [Eremococcus coleocola]EFR30965.1 efflux ABC transporter, permease protein [Eremococcus coleocola ACS-139-V-Col8]
MKLAWQEIRFNLKKYALVEFLLFMMIFMVVFLSGLTNGLGRWVSAGIENQTANQYLLSSDSEGVVTFSDLENQADLEKYDLDSGAGLTIQRSGVTFNDVADKQDITYFVVDPDKFLAPQTIEGQDLSQDAKGIVLNESFKADGLKVGDTLKDSSSDLELKVIGFAKDAYYGHSPVGFISPEIFTQIRQSKQKDYTYSPQTYAFEDKIEAEESQDLVLMGKADLIEKIPGYSAEQSTLNMILWVLLGASAAILGVFFYIMTIQKTRQFGVLKAIGMTMAEISRIQLWQVFLLALIGVVLGAGLAIGLGQLLPVTMPFHLNYLQVALECLAFIAITLLTSLASIRRISQIDPASIIGGSED